MRIGQKYLVSVDNWFHAPDGNTYRAVFGTVHAVVDSVAVLGLRPNRHSTNWYVVIGDTVVAGCQVHYAVRAETFSPEPGFAEVDHNGVRHSVKNGMTRIYDADASGLVATVAE